MDSNILAHNLRRLREARKLSQGEIAERSQLSRVAYGNIESGSSNPRVDTLLRIAEVLGVKMQELLVPVRILKAVRFRALKKMTTREQILVDAARWLEDYSELEKMLGKRVPYQLEPLAKELGKKKRGPHRAREAAEAARKRLLENDDKSIRDICGLLEERAGVKVCAMPVASDAFFGLSVAKSDGGPAIAVNVWDRISVERWIFTAAHELGHLLLHFDAFDASESEENKDEEDEANQFASHFLMPDDVFRQEWDEAHGQGLVDRVFKVKRIFRVSYRTVLYRLSQMEKYGSSIWVQFQVAYKARTGQPLLKSDEPHGATPQEFLASIVSSRAAEEPKRLEEDDFVEDRLSGLVREAFDRQLISVSRAGEILGLDLQKIRERIASWV